MFDINVPMVLRCRIEAETPERAAIDAIAWANWCDPTADQLEDYRSDHNTGVQDFGMGGVLGVTGEPTITPAGGKAPGFTR
ncbi:hypothetical protein [Sphingomonas sp. ACRSK]|uniref:hypothetical protein n=1 Tax=Sphingomonas sp. ACRSK TaxID=2918213 RepID=UPI001EF5B789|nr:hypothetical protein [Sphingomonas sp. ACRSK]